MKETNPHFTGTQVNYYFVCRRKLWLFSRGVQMEHESDTVLQGKLIGEESYERRQKEIDIAGTIVLDGYDPVRKVVHEVKKSKAIETAHKWQMMYYLYFLRQLGVEARGEIDYPLLRRREEILLGEDEKNRMEQILIDIGKLIQQAQAPALSAKRLCLRCAYYEFCWG